eukprot:2568905-Rhodomonas_salina.1
MYMVKKRILDLEKIMAVLFSDAVTLPVDVLCGLADVTAFTISSIMVLEDATGPAARGADLLAVLRGGMGGEYLQRHARCRGDVPPVGGEEQRGGV